MKIKKIDILKHRPTERGWGPLLCRIYTDEGIFGDGEAGLNFGGATEAAWGIMRDLAKLLIGCDPLSTEVLWTKMYRECFWGRNGGPIVFAGISALDIALWDIKGKAFDCPVYELLGGRMRSELRSYASQLQNGWGEARKKPARSPQDYALYAKRAVEQGYDAVKVNLIWFDEKDGDFGSEEQSGLMTPRMRAIIDERMAATREAAGPDTDIILENHSYTDVQSAVQMGDIAGRYGVYYFEEPCTPQPELYRKVHLGTRIPVAGGERIFSRWQYHRYLEQDALQVLQPDIGTCGGISEVKKICDMAFMYESSVQLHSSGSPIGISATLQVEAALPNFLIHEHNAGALAPSVQAIGKVDVSPKNGVFTVPDIPGIGNEISECAFYNSDIAVIE